MQPFNQSLKYKNWIADLEKNEIQVSKIEEIHSVRKSNGEVLFSLLRIDAKGKDGIPLLPVVMLRGNFVSIVTCLKDKTTGEEWLLLVKQRRVATGDYFYEHPAGMMDSHEDPFEVAMIEMEEETGVKIKREDLVLLNEEPFFSSPGLLDERGWFFCCELEMESVKIHEMQNRAQGSLHEGEFISTMIVKQEEAWKIIRNSNGLLNLALYERWKSDNHGYFGYAQ